MNALPDESKRTKQKIYMNKLGIQKNIENTYTAIAALFEQSVRSHLFDKQEIDIFFQSLSPDSLVLDAGCGTGVISNEIKNEYAHDVIGVDISDGMVNFAKKHYQGIEFKKMDVLKLDFPDDSFDAVFAYFILIHISKKDIPKALAEFKRVLKPNGKIFFSFQLSNEKPIEDFYPLPYDQSKKLFLNVISEEEIEKQITEAGFSINHKIIREPQESEFNFKKLLISASKGVPQNHSK